MRHHAKNPDIQFSFSLGVTFNLCGCTWQLQIKPWTDRADILGLSWQIAASSSAYCNLIQWRTQFESSVNEFIRRDNPDQSHKFEVPDGPDSTGRAEILWWIPPIHSRWAQDDNSSRVKHRTWKRKCFVWTDFLFSPILVTKGHFKMCWHIQKIIRGNSWNYFLATIFSNEESSITRPNKIKSCSYVCNSNSVPQQTKFVRPFFPIQIELGSQCIKRSIQKDTMEAANVCATTIHVYIYTGKMLKAFQQIFLRDPTAL